MINLLPFSLRSNLYTNNAPVFRAQHDEFKRFVYDEFEMTDKLGALLVRFWIRMAGSKKEREKRNLVP